MFRLRAFLILAALAGPGTPVARGQQADPLGPLVAEALRSNLGVEQERQADRRAVAELHEARGLFLPSVTLNSRYSHLESVLNFGELVNPAYAALNRLTGTTQFPTNIDITQPRAHDTSVRLLQPIFNEEILGNYALARSQRDAQRMKLGSTARALAAEVQTAYLRAASARRAAEVYEASLDLVHENERVSERLLEAGRATPDVVYRARAERAKVEQELAEARERQTAAGRDLNRILRRPLDTAVEVMPDSVFEWPLPVSEDSAVANGLGVREELHEADAGVRAAQAEKRVATATYVPSLSVVLDYGFQGQDFSFHSDEDYWVASLVASWHVFDGWRGASRRAAAGEEVDRSRTLRQDLAERIEVEIRTAYGEAAVAWSAIATADTRLVATRRTFELVRRRYEEGAAASIEFVDARTAFTNAQLNRVLTGYGYAIRWVELERAAALRAPAF
jgi:outer membrane protein TolC